MNKTTVKPATKRKSWRVEREFGLSVGGVLLLVSSWWLYRGKLPDVRQVTMITGALLVVLGLVFPRVLVLPNKAWMALAAVYRLSQPELFLGFVVFSIVTPIGVFKRFWMGSAAPARK